MRSHQNYALPCRLAWRFSIYCLLALLLLVLDKLIDKLLFIMLFVLAFCQFLLVLAKIEMRSTQNQKITKICWEFKKKKRVQTRQTPKLHFFQLLYVSLSLSLSNHNFLI